MILAAGLGTRMAPLARALAKPALPVLDVPVALRLVRALAEQGVTRVVVNTHAHPESVLRALADAPVPVDWIEEPELRGSGGGVRGARERLDGDEPFLVLNGDMCLDLDVTALVARHRARKALLTLALRDDPRKREFGSIGYDVHGDVRRITERIDLGGEKGSGLFIGVQVMEPTIFARMPATDRFEIVPEVWVPALQSGLRIASWVQPAGARWWPVGSPRELLDANLDELDAASRGGAVLVDPQSRVAGTLVGPAWIGAGAEIEAGATIGPRAVVSRGARVAAGARVADVLVLPDARIAGGAQLSRAVAFADEVWRDG
ncbi:MAG: NDP-sugar synthase [Myxococcota bacterium]